ncbi:MAG: 50S ribosomal protein L7ae [Candidatus Aenigmarchaeota archaeon]|nr:50S ribosomal protein L7ae [Candidatus Aenigmarchaeota archaeon]
MPKSNAKFEVPKELSDKVLQLVEAAKNTGKIRKGINESTKAVEKGESKLLVIASDVQPEEIVMHLGPLCDEKKIPYVYVPSKMEIGRAAGIDVPCAAVCVVEAGTGKELLKEVADSISKLTK